MQRINKCCFGAGELNELISGMYPEYPQVHISKGKLPAAENALATVMENGNIHFSFTDNSNTGNAAANDKIIVVAYAEALQQAIFSLNAGYRKDGAAVLQTGLFKSYAVDTWIGFLSNDETNASGSCWTGRMELR